MDVNGCRAVDVVVDDRALGLVVRDRARPVTLVTLTKNVSSDSIAVSPLTSTLNVYVELPAGIVWPVSVFAVKSLGDVAGVVRGRDVERDTTRPGPARTG